MAGSSLENVADLIAKPLEEFVREPRYVSKYREKVRSASKRGKSAHKTLGVPNVNLNPPTEFLKKNSNSAALRQRPEVHHKHYRRADYQRKLPEWQPVKRAGEETRNSRSHSVDFTKRNIDEATKLRPLKPRKYYVDDRHGTTHPLRTSGLFPVYRNRKNYGQVPGGDSLDGDDRAKLRERKATSSQSRDKSKVKNREDKSEKQTEDKSDTEKKRKSQEGKLNEGTKAEDSKLEVKSAKSSESSVKRNSSNSYNENDGESIKSSRPQQPRCRYVTEDERAELLYGMKKKWDEMMKKFQCLPFLTDTPPKAKRKSKMENDLRQLEKDIEVIERHPYIYVYSDGEEAS